jgi:hypothetical protein
MYSPIQLNIRPISGPRGPDPRGEDCVLDPLGSADSSLGSASDLYLEDVNGYYHSDNNYNSSNQQLLRNGNSSNSHYGNNSYNYGNSRNNINSAGGLSIMGSAALASSGSSVGFLRSSNPRTNTMLEELLARKQAIADKLKREKRPRKVHRNALRQLMSSGASLVDGGGSFAGNESLGAMSSLSPERASITSQSKLSPTHSITKSTGTYFNNSINNGNSVIEDTNMTLFTQKSHIFVKKTTANPHFGPLDNTVPVVFPHYETKKVSKESHSKAFRDKIAEVLLQSQRYAKIEQPYLFSMLKQSGGKSTAYLSGKSSAEIIEEAYRKAEITAREAQEAAIAEQKVQSTRASTAEGASMLTRLDSVGSSKSSSAANSTEKLKMIGGIKLDAGDDIFKYVPKKKGLTPKHVSAKEKAATKNNKNKAAAAPPPPPPVKLEVMNDDALEELLVAVDRDRLNYHLNRQVALARTNRYG